MCFILIAKHQPLSVRATDPLLLGPDGRMVNMAKQRLIDVHQFLQYTQATNVRIITIN